MKIARYVIFAMLWYKLAAPFSSLVGTYTRKGYKHLANNYLLCFLVAEALFFLMMLYAEYSPSSPALLRSFTPSERLSSAI